MPFDCTERGEDLLGYVINVFAGFLGGGAPPPHA